MNDLLNQEQLKDAIKDNKYLLLDFWAPWCGPCKQMSMILPEIERDVTVLKINVDNFPSIAGEHSVMGIPTLVWYKDGEAVKTQSGVQNYNQLTATLKELKGE